MRRLLLTACAVLAMAGSAAGQSQRPPDISAQVGAWTITGDISISRRFSSCAASITSVDVRATRITFTELWEPSRDRRFEVVRLMTDHWVGSADALLIVDGDERGAFVMPGDIEADGTVRLHPLSVEEARRRQALQSGRHAILRITANSLRRREVIEYSIDLTRAGAAISERDRCSATLVTRMGFRP